MPDRNETDSAKAASTQNHYANAPVTAVGPDVAAAAAAAGLRRNRSGNVSEFSYSHLGNSGEGFKGETTKEFPIETVSPEEGRVSRIGEFVLAPDPAYTRDSRDYSHTNGGTPNGGLSTGRHDYSFRM